MPNKIRHFNLDNNGTTMTTLKVLELSRTSSITEVIEAIDKYGAENVTLHCVSDVLYESSKIYFSDYESYIKLSSIGNKETITSLFNELVSNPDNAEGIANAAGVSIVDFYERMLTIGIEKDVYFENIPTITPLHILNALAEKNLLRMFHIERTYSIDLDFVRKYADDLDLRNLQNYTKNNEIHAYIDTYTNNTEQETD